VGDLVVGASPTKASVGDGTDGLAIPVAGDLRGTDGAEVSVDADSHQGGSENELVAHVWIGLLVGWLLKVEELVFDVFVKGWLVLMEECELMIA